MDINTIRDLLVTGAKNTVTEAAKQEVIGWIKNKGLPTARDIVNEYSAQIKGQASGKNGWCYFRDSIFLPGIFSAALWATETLLDRIIAAQEKA